MVTPPSAPRFMLSPEDLAGATAVLTGADARHARVLRLRAGDAVRLCDGRGREVSGRVGHATAESVAVELGAELRRDPAPAFAVTLVHGLARGEKLDWTLQKATELGLARFAPVLTARSQVKPERGGDRRLERWREIARQAARQAERTWVPEIAPVSGLAQALAQARAFDLALLPFEHADPARSWKAVAARAPRPRSAAVFIGPEGGFTDDEAAQAEAAGVVPVSLGANILRTETAGLVAVALALYTWGDLGGRS